ncbi:hypothetical protein D9M71_129110 [compost metagenome]
MHRQGALGRILAPVERVSVGPALALGIDIDAADLVGEGVDQTPYLGRVGAEDTQLLTEVRLQDVIDDRSQVAVRHHRDDRPELLFMVHAHGRGDRVEHGGVEERTVGLAARRVDHLGALVDGIADQGAQVVELARLGQWRQGYARLPWHARFEAGELTVELVDETVDHPLVNEQDLQRRATLAVERQGAGNCLVDGVVQVDLGQHDTRVLRIQAQRCAQAMGAWVQFFQVAGRLVGADEGEDIDIATGHQRTDGFPATAIDHIDDTGREAVAESFQQRTDEQHAEFCRLEHHGVAHDQCRNQSGEGFVERIVVGAHAQGDAQRHTTDLAQGVLFQLETAGASVELLERVDGVDDVIAGAVEFLFRILEVFADLPHQ